MTRFNIRKRLAVKALDKLGTALDKLEVPPEVENWLLYRATKAAATHAIVPIMAGWPKTKGVGIGVIRKTWRDHIFIQVRRQSWADGTFHAVFGGKDPKPNNTYGVNFGSTSKGPFTVLAGKAQINTFKLRKGVFSKTSRCPLKPTIH